jgi:endonuclease/exonuclease/phosphatase family metal-dependent hydrolase
VATAHSSPLLRNYIARKVSSNDMETTLSPTETIAAEPKPRQRIMRILSRVALFCFDVYALLIIIYLILRLIVGESWGVIALANAIMPTILLPALVIFPLLLIGRKWRRAALMSPAVIAFVVLYGELFLPSFSVTSENAPRMSVMTFNLEAQVEPVDEIVEIIRESGADIIGLQEVTETAARRFERDLSVEYPYQFSFTDGDAALTGSAVLSRYPLENPIRLPGVLTHMRVDVRPPQEACLPDFVFYSAHPPPGGWAVQANSPNQPVRDVDDLLAWAEADTLPVIMAGDFNMTDQSTNYRFMSERFEDAFREAGWGLGITWPNGYGNFLTRLMPPILRIDYVFYDPSAFQAVEAHVIPHSGGSDHFAVVARLDADPPTLACSG